MTSRELILRRLRTTGEPVPLPASYGGWDIPDDPVGLFVSRASAVGIEVLRPTGPQWGDSLAAALRERGVQSAAVWDDPLLEPARAALRSAGLTIVAAAEHTKERLADVDAGITTADYAVALSGTLVLSCDPQRPRSTSLLPPLHVAVLPVDRIIPTLGELFARMPTAVPSALTFITGPSRTADIEMTVVRGVHGPVSVVVFLIE
jgi:L-lactate dehydrogenase complex protein LldG